MAGAPKGNKNARLGGMWRSALKMALAKRHGSYIGGLVKVAEQVVAAADGGDLQAAQHIADRIDGRAMQRTEAKITHEHTVDTGSDIDIAERLRAALAKRTEPTVQ